MKIAYIGTHGTGKSAQALLRASEEKQANMEKQIGVFSEVARSCPFPINKTASREAQLWIWASQLKGEIASQRDNAILVCDRSLLDNLMYSQVLGFNGIVMALLPFTLQWLKTYDELIWMRPNGKVATDSVRDPDVAWQLKVDSAFAHMIYKEKLTQIQEVTR